MSSIRPAAAATAVGNHQGLCNEKIGADDVIRDDREKSEAHLPRPPEYRSLPTPQHNRHGKTAGWPGSLSQPCVTNASELRAESLQHRLTVRNPLRRSRYYLPRMPTQPRGHVRTRRYVRHAKELLLRCGRNNPDGNALKFSYDESATVRLRFRPGKRFTGPPGHCHGGIIATILDEAMGKVNKCARHCAHLRDHVSYLSLCP